jgi:hypothetical protein
MNNKENSIRNLSSIGAVYKKRVQIMQFYSSAFSALFAPLRGNYKNAVQSVQNAQSPFISGTNARKTPKSTCTA